MMFMVLDLKVDPALSQVGSFKTISGYHNQKKKHSQNSENGLDLRSPNTSITNNNLSNNRKSPPKNKTRYLL